MLRNNVLSWVHTISKQLLYDNINIRDFILYSSIAQSVSALDFNFEQAGEGSILTAGKNLKVTILAIN